MTWGWREHVALAVIVIIGALGMTALLYYASQQPDHAQERKIANCIERGGYVQTGYYGQYTGCIYGVQP